MMPSEKRQITLRQTLVWAYRLQMVHLRDTGADPRRDRRLTASIADSAARVAAVANGLAGRGSINAVPLQFHPDAELLHDAVLALGDFCAPLVIAFARTGTVPTLPLPLPEPVPPSGYGCGQWEDARVGEWRGERVEYRVLRAAETERTPIYAPGRPKRGNAPKIVGWEDRPVFAEYCPVRYWPEPTPEYLAAALDQAALWSRTMERLAARVAEVIFTAHSLIAQEPEICKAA